MSRSVPSELDGFLAPFPDHVVKGTLALRSRVLERVPNAHEIVWDAVNAVSIGFAPTERWQDGPLHIATYARHVNLGFSDGASLPDPARTLVGSGRRIRHATFRSEADVLGAEWLDDYIAAALSLAGYDGFMGDGGTTIRVMAGEKRRP